jgi:membrane dipeptidase
VRALRLMAASFWRIFMGLKTLTTIAAMALTASAVQAQSQPVDYGGRVAHLLKTIPLIDGHNDWADVLRTRSGEARWTIDLHNLPTGRDGYNTDIDRLRRGMVGGQFWSVYVDSTLPGAEQVKQTLEQIELVRDIARRYPATFGMARTAADVRQIHKSGRIASLIGVEGGGQIDGSLGVLRAYRELGVGYLTLTHVHTIEWADSATDDPKHGGLTPFGESVVRELNRIGMLVDLSHVSEATMLDALRISTAPVIFSHSGARGLVDHPRNVSDNVLKRVAANGGVVMVNFAPFYVSDAYRRWAADEAAETSRMNSPPFNGLYIGQPDKAAAAVAAWRKANPAPPITLSMVADHIEHIAQVAGKDHVGIGSDFDGVGSVLPTGLEDVSTYPALLAELMRRGWTDEEVGKLAGGNILRVMAQAERISSNLTTASDEFRQKVADK